MTVHVLVEFQAQPGKRDELATALEEKAYPSISRADGFRKITMLRDRAAADRLVELEEWDSQEQYEAWVGPALAELGPVMQTLLKEPPRLVLLDAVASVEPAAAG